MKPSVPSEPPVQPNEQLLIEQAAAEKSVDPKLVNEQIFKITGKTTIVLPQASVEKIAIHNIMRYNNTWSSCANKS